MTVQRQGKKGRATDNMAQQSVVFSWLLIVIFPKYDSNPTISVAKKLNDDRIMAQEYRFSGEYLGFLKHVRMIYPNEISNVLILRNRKDTLYAMTFVLVPINAIKNKSRMQ